MGGGGGGGYRYEPGDSPWWESLGGMGWGCVGGMIGSVP